MASVDLIDRAALVPASQAHWLTERTAMLLSHLGLEGELRVEMVDDAAMGTAHERWLNDPSTTDVMTFDLRESPDAPLDTDLMVCVDEARRQAETRGLPIEHELLLYITHGLLHCLGHNDHEPEDFQRMHEREDELLSAIGLGGVFAAQAAGGEA